MLHFFSYFEDIKDEAAKYHNSVPFPWIEAKLRQFGLEVYNHNFTLNFPLGDKRTFTGKNVYAILRAPRASSNEALVLSVPYRPPSSVEESTDASLAVLLATAKFFRRQNYWAKDIIFLVTQHEQLGMQAWLEAYHQRTLGQKGVLDHGDLPARAGSIQAAINLEMSSLRMTHFNFRLEGLNGQLPNLDLFNLVNRLCIREGVGQMFQGVEDHTRPGTLRGYRHQLKTLTAMALKQATGVPSGNHGLFHRFGIEALTMEGVFHKKKRSHHEIPVRSVGSIVEGTFRSLNNLLERFHQSFFFYLLPSSSSYVSIGMYMPAFGALGGAFVIRALGMWLESVWFEQEKKNRELQDSGVIQPPVVIPAALRSTAAIFTLSHVLGVIMSHLPKHISVLGAGFGLETEDSIVLGLLAFILYGLVLPKFSKNLIVVNTNNWRVLKCITLLELSILAFTMALSNFSLAFFTTLIYVPLALVSAPSKSSLAWFSRVLFCLFCHPLSILAIVCCVDTLRTFAADHPAEKLLYMCVDATKRALCYSITDGIIFGNINYSVATLFLVPCWYLLWSLNFVKEVEDDVKTIEAAPEVAKKDVDKASELVKDAVEQIEDRTEGKEAGAKARRRKPKKAE